MSTSPPSKQCPLSGLLNPAPVKEQLETLAKMASSPPEMKRKVLVVAGAAVESKRRKYSSIEKEQCLTVMKTMSENEENSRLQSGSQFSQSKGKIEK